MQYVILHHEEPLERPLILDQVWTSPHYDFAKEYIKTYYSTENVFTVPYIWDSYFVDEKIKELSKKSLSPFFKKKKPMMFVYLSLIDRMLKAALYR